MMRIMVTGAAGFIGSTVVDLLQADDHDVVPVDLLLPAAHDRRPGWAAENLVVADVRDESAMTRLLSGVDLVCHQAAMVGVGKDTHDAPEYVSHNLFGTSTLLSAMTRARVGRLVLASSMVVYGDGAYRCAEHDRVRPLPRRQKDLDRGLFDPVCPVCAGPLDWQLVGESAVLDPRTTYAVTKLGQEQLAGAWAAQSGGSVISLRYHNVYGPRMPRDTPYAGVASMFRSSLMAGRSPVVFEDGRQLRDFVHVSDVAAANVSALNHLVRNGSTSPGHTAYNIASGEPRPIIDLAARLAQTMGGPAPQVRGGGRPGDVRHIVADPALADSELGFRAAVTFDAGVAQFATDPMRDGSRSSG